MKVRISKMTLIGIIEAMPENTPFEDCLPEFVEVEGEPVEGEKRELLAELEHEQWIAWSKDIANTEDINADRYHRWKKLWRPYADLTEAEKDQDREWADKVLAIVAHTPKSECRCPGLCPLHFRSVAPKTGECCNSCWIYNDAYGPKLGYCSKSVCPCHTKREECCELCILPRMSKPMCGNRQCKCHQGEEKSKTPLADILFGEDKADHPKIERLKGSYEGIMACVDGQGFMLKQMYDKINQLIDAYNKGI